MLTPTRRPARAGATLAAIAVAGLAATWAGTASAQNVFDPYMPYNWEYYSFVAPTQPINLALPNAAREAAAYNGTGGGVSRYNTFNRWLDDYDTDSSRGRRGTGAADRDDVDRSDMSVYIPNREADRRFYREREGSRRDREYFQQESDRARIAVERDRYFNAACRVTDPGRRAAYMKVVARLSDPKTALKTLREIDEAQEDAASRPASEARRPIPSAAPRNTTAPHAPGTETPATTRASAPATGTPPATGSGSPPAVTPTPGVAPAASAPSRGPALPDAPPPMPAERRVPRASGPAPLPSSVPAPLPAPTPLPDEVPPPPR